MRAASIGNGNYYCTSGKINARRHRCRGKYCVEQTGGHHFFDHQFPRRHVSSVMRCDPTANDRVPVTMIANLRMLLDKTPFEFAAGIAAIVGRWATTEGGLRCSLITAPARRQKNDCR